MQRKKEKFNSQIIFLLAILFTYLLKAKNQNPIWLTASLLKFFKNL